VLAHDSLQAVEQGVQEPMYLLGVQAFRDAREPGQVREQDRDELALARGQ
jgi:hypothetical protein